MKSVELLVAKAKEAGIKEAEVVVVKLFDVLCESVKEASVSEEATSAEKITCGILGPILEGFKPAVAQYADLNKDGVVG